MNDRKQPEISFPALSLDEIVNDFWGELLTLSGIKNPDFLPPQKITRVFIKKQQVIDCFDEFSHEMLRLYGQARYRFVFREYGSNHFTFVLTKNTMTLAAKIEQSLHPSEKVNWHIFTQNKLAKRRLQFLANSLIDLLGHQDIAQAVLEYQNSVSHTLISELLRGKIGKEWLMSISERVRIGTDVTLGADYLLHEVREYPEVYATLAYWLKRLDLDDKALEELKNFLVESQKEVEGGYSEDHLRTLSTRYLEHQGFDIVCGVMPS